MKSGGDYPCQDGGDYSNQAIASADNAVKCLSGGDKPRRYIINPNESFPCTLRLEPCAIGRLAKALGLVKSI